LRPCLLLVLLSTVISCKKDTAPNNFENLVGEWDWKSSINKSSAATLTIKPEFRIPPSPTLITFYSDSTFINESHCGFDIISYLSEGTFDILSGSSDGKVQLIIDIPEHFPSPLKDTLWLEIRGTAMTLTEFSDYGSTLTHEFKKRR
jgi:hypothetical protein